jgi:uncharacterized membrane protein YqjE
MIPKEVHGLPLHPLVVHAAVVLIPLAALLAVLFVIPRTRRWAALPMALVAVGALGTVWLARKSGTNLFSHVEDTSGLSDAKFKASTIGKAIVHHESLANTLFYILIPFAIVAVIVYLIWLRPSWMPSGLRFTGAVQYGACALLIIGAAVVTYQCYRTGEAGSKAVYNPDGSVNFNSSAPLLLHP